MLWRRFSYHQSMLYVYDYLFDEGQNSSYVSSIELRNLHIMQKNKILSRINYRWFHSLAVQNWWDWISKEHVGARLPVCTPGWDQEVDGELSTAEAIQQQVHAIHYNNYKSECCSVCTAQSYYKCCTHTYYRFWGWFLLLDLRFAVRELLTTLLIELELLKKNLYV